MSKLDNLEKIEIRSAKELWQWLESSYAQKESVWLVTVKKSQGTAYVPREVILEALMAYGWVDSLPRKLDEKRTMILISPRKVGSSWSRVNKEIANRLETEGRMAEPGRSLVQQAKEDGSWSRLDDVENLVIPDDLGAALDARPNARKLFERFPPSSRRAILEWILNAKQPATRVKRIAATAEKAAA